MESILKGTPSFEQLIEELDKLKKKILLLEKSNSEIDIDFKSVKINDYPSLLKLATGNSLSRKQDVANELQYLNEISNLKSALVNEIKEKEALKKELDDTKQRIEELEKKNVRVQKRSEKFFQLTKQLKNANADLENFIYSASHDLRSPISNLEGLIQILKIELGEKIGTSELTLIKMIGTSIARFKQTIFDLTELSTFQKQMEEASEPVGFKEVLEDVKSNINNKIEESEAQIITDLQVSEVKFARKNLRSVIFNLLINAIKYRSSRRPLKIFIRSKRKGNFIIFEIEDNGLGFLPEQKEKLFQMFKRLHTHVDGTGVGLYIVKKIVENSGGRIEVNSNIDKGSTFRIFFKA